MTDRLAGKRLRAAIKRLGISSRAFAKANQITPATLRNVICGNNRARETRERITNWFGQEFWPDVPITAHQLILGPHMEMQCPTVAGAKELALGLQRILRPGVVCRRGKVVSFKDYDIVTVAK